MTHPHDQHPLYRAINRKLAEIVEAASEPPAWKESWLSLGPDSSEENRLAVYRSIRDSGSLPPEAGFFLISWQIDAITLQDAEEQLCHLEERVEQLRQEHGLDEDEPIPDDAPTDLVEAQKQVNDAWDALYAEKLDELGEPEMAELFRSDRDEFEQRTEAGRLFFHDDDSWLDDLLDLVTSCIEADSPMGPFGLRYHEEDGFWEVIIHPTPVELLGGRHDGEVVVPGFSLDLEELRSAFDSIGDMGWNALGLTMPDGPYIYVEGVFAGREVYLQVLAYPPEDEQPGMKLDATEKSRRRS